MRQQHTYSIAQSYAYTPSKDILQRPQERRASRFVSFVLGFTFGTGLAILLAQLSSWFSS